MARNLAEKEAFFKELDKMGSMTDDPEDPEDEEFARLVSGTKLVQRKEAVAPSLPVVKNIDRTRSMPQPSLRSPAGPHSDDTITVRESPLVAGDDVKKPTMKRAATTGTLPETKAKGPGHVSKKRRSYSAKAIPEQQQIFKGLVFCG